MTTHRLSTDVKAKLDHWIEKYPAEQKQSAIIPALHIMQDAEGGWLPQEAIDAVADYLEMPRIAAYEVASFYSMFELKPASCKKIGLCTNIACMLMGSDKVADHLKKRLGVGFGETTADGKFSLREVECLGACASAPVMHFEKAYHEHLTPEKVDEILGEAK